MMIPYSLVRLPPGEATPAPKQYEQTVRTWHTMSNVGRLFVVLGSSIIAADNEKLGWWVAISLPYLFVTPAISYYALRSKSPLIILSAGFVPDWLWTGYAAWLSGGDPIILLGGLTLNIGNSVSFVNNRLGIAATFVSLLSAVVSDAYFQSADFWFSYEAPAVAIIVGYVWAVSSASLKATKRARQRGRQIESLNQQIKEQVLIRYLPPTLISDIFDGKVSMDTKPSMQEVTVLFSDLSGFTQMSEEQGAETVAEFLNDYLTTMNETIFANHGTIDKFIGDAIMVLFGAPVPMDSKKQAENAAQCARAMQAGMMLVNEKWRTRGLKEVSMRIGIHQGTAVVGNFGSSQRVDYTAIGPNVNLASRIESACIPGEIFVSPDISELLSPQLTEEAGEFELKGISGKTSLYRLVS